MRHTSFGRGLTRRQSLAAIGLGSAALASGMARAQNAAPPEPLSTITTPRRSFGPDAEPNVYFWDPDVIAVDDAFNGLAQPNAPIRRLWTGALWAEGPAWNSVGRFLVWSDIPNNRQMRWLEEDGHVSTFRAPSNNSNGNSFDRQGRQLTCEHLTRRVVRYELDGSVTILADRYEGLRFNSPNDVVEHPDGSIWFTDPPYGGQLYEGAPDAAGGPSNPDGLIDNTLGQPPEIGAARREMGHGIYRIAADGSIARVIEEAQVQDPNGLCFSPDGSRLYVASTGKGPGDTGEGGKGEILTFDIAADGAASNGAVFSDCMVDGVKCGPDGLRCDVYGNLWASSNAGRAVGYSGVTCWSPQGALLGRIRLPEVCGNICFGGPKRNVLFMAASQSLYALPTATQGAGPS
ncbi:SMP-30/gluconolactonase/LRE family protein [Paracoccus sp. M683]|uniref:SMP-30/gluconolactonase/LRE family protein n=1 Tax=Paracoccus sp. M683 TaxID=2594268 RepID=UPI00117C152D|nr:SMP-30/gluconolactonase/LRE family protein [Paracoccus sp. M683]TRW99640.1 SMP-30/gluconolactonase/LRE family protein [Paracoccus sp. M683]